MLVCPGSSEKGLVVDIVYNGGAIDITLILVSGVPHSDTVFVYIVK